MYRNSFLSKKTVLYYPVFKINSCNHYNFSSYIDLSKCFDSYHTKLYYKDVSCFN